MKSTKTMFAAATLSVALLLGAGATGANATPVANVHAATATQTVKTTGGVLRPATSGACWAQAGRVIGGFWGTLIASAATPWAAAFYYAAYLGQMAQEKKDAHGNFVC